MKEITRIHLAKIPYNIELEAKRQLEHYLQAVESYAGEDTLTDIELRITELLAERQIKADSTITRADIAALQSQLGDPEAFADEDALVGQAAGTLPIVSRQSPRRLFRDPSQMLLGGVASGIARYLGLDIWVIRAILVVLGVVSFGTVALIYAILWAIIPVAKTPGEWLQLTGRPVTVANLRDVDASIFTAAHTRSRRTIRVLTILLGLGFVLGMVIALGITGIGTYYTLFDHHAINAGLLAATGPVPLYGSIALLIISGIMLTALMTLAAYASFAQKFTRRLVVAAALIIVSGLTTSITGSIIFVSSNKAIQSAIKNHTQEIVLDTPAGLNAITQFESNVDGANVAYVSTTDQPHATIRQTAWADEDLIRPRLEVNGKTARLILDQTPAQTYCGGFCDRPTITIYGPVLDAVTAQKGSLDYRAAQHQASINAVMQRNARISFIDSTIDNLTADLANGATLSADGASIKTVNAKTTTGSYLALGAVQLLRLDAPEYCANDGSVRVSLNAGHVTLGDRPITAPYHTPCVDITLTEQD